MEKPSGYSGTPLVKKLGIKPGFHIGLIGEPAGYMALLHDLPDNIHWHKNVDTQELDMVHIFVKDMAFYSDILAKAKRAIKTSGTIWVSWPKKTSGTQTDINANIIRTVALGMGLVDVKVCAIDN